MANKLVLEVVADSNGFVKGLNQAQTHLEKFMKASDAAGASVGGGLNRALDTFRNLAGGGANAAGVLAGAFVAATTAAFGMTVQAGKIAEQTEQLKQKTGLAAVSLEGMSVAMARHGLESGSIAVAMKSLSKELVGVSQGTQSSIKLFQSLGVSLQTVEKGTGATLRAIADAFQQMPDGAQKATFAVELFGKSGLDLIPILNTGAAGLDEAMKKSAEFGLILSDTARGDLTVFDDAMDDLGSALNGFAMQVGVAFAPSLTALVTAFTDVIVFTKNVFNQFADAASTLTIRLSAMVASVQVMANTLFSLKAFSKAAWEETINHVKAIDQWAAAEITGVQAARESETSLAALAGKHLDAAQAAQVHVASQERLGQQIVAATKIQLAQAAAAGKQQERMGADIVSGTQIMLSQEAAEGDRQKRLAQGIISTTQIQLEQDRQRGESQERLGRDIVASTQIQLAEASKANAFWRAQLEALVDSNAFSIAQITTMWSGQLANAIVNGGTFVKEAWQATQVAIIQGAINTTIQYLAQLALRSAADKAAAMGSGAVWMGASKVAMGAFAAVAGGIKTMFATVLMPAIIAVGKFIMGVLTAIALAMKKTIFGIPLGVAILAGVVAIGAALAASGAIKFADGGIATGPTLGMVGEAGSSEAVIPLNKRGAAFMQEALGMPHEGSGSLIVPVYLDGREIARSVVEELPSAWRRAGLPI